MVDEEFERAAVSWLASRGWLCKKLDSITVELDGHTVEAFSVPTEALLSPPEAPPSLFDEFWGQYPRKIGKEAAKKIFNRLAPHEQRNAVHGLEQHLAADAFSSEKCYIKHPSTWLNQKVYLDEPERRSWPKPQIGNRDRSALDDFLDGK